MGAVVSDVRQMDTRTRIPFDFMYKVNASPLIVRRSTFLRVRPLPSEPPGRTTRVVEGGNAPCLRAYMSTLASW